MSRIYRIELRCEFAENDRYAIAEQALRGAARKLYSQVKLIADIREPEVALISEDAFMGTDELLITEVENGSG